MIRILDYLASFSPRDWHPSLKLWWYKHGLGEWHYDRHVLLDRLRQTIEELEEDRERLLKDPDYYADAQEEQKRQDEYGEAFRFCQEAADREIPADVTGVARLRRQVEWMGATTRLYRHVDAAGKLTGFSFEPHKEVQARVLAKARELQAQH